MSVNRQLMIHMHIGVDLDPRDIGLFVDNSKVFEWRLDYDWTRFVQYD